MMAAAGALRSTTDLAAAAGISYRVLDHWYRTGAIHPARAGVGSGNPHGWDQTQFAAIVAIGRVRRDLAAWDIDMPTTLVATLYRRLVAVGQATIVAGTVTIAVGAQGDP